MLDTVGELLRVCFRRRTHQDILRAVEIFLKYSVFSEHIVIDLENRDPIYDVHCNYLLPYPCSTLLQPRVNEF
jgi:hypothetical protein